MNNSYRVAIDGATIRTRPGELLLDALLRNRIEVAFSCRGGTCQTCLLRCVSGEIPAAAQRGIAVELRARGYLMPCQCLPLSDLTLERARTCDMVTTCMLLEVVDVRHELVVIRFETARVVSWRAGETLELLGEAVTPIRIELTTVDSDSSKMEAVVSLPFGGDYPSWLGDRSAFGEEFRVRGPVDAVAIGRADAPGHSELGAPACDSELWAELGEGAVVRDVLLDFYAEVYRDPLLSPFFQRVTQQRLVEKQYSFLKQLMTGEKVYFGDRPRNAHHWMVISNELFDYRHALMVRMLLKHGLDAGQIARWARLELHYRRDIVKANGWPRKVAGVDQPLDGFAFETLSEGTVCDSCNAAIDAGTLVGYHRRLGHVVCSACAPTVARTAPTEGSRREGHG